MTRATRASTRAASQDDSPKKAEQNGASPSSLKRKADPSDSPAAASKKRGRATKGGEAQQKTIEETMPDMPDDKEVAEEMDGDATNGKGDYHGKGDDGEKAEEKAKPKTEEGETTTKDETEAKPETKTSDGADKNGETNGTEHGEADDKAGDMAGQSSKMDYTGEVSKTGDDNGEATADASGSGAVQSSQSRGDAMPSNILEKGLIYFFIRPRVGMDQSDAAGVQDVARSYIVLRPIPNNAKLTEGAVEDAGNNRLLALPKKVLPRTHNDKFMVFVESAGASIEQLKEQVLQGSTYDTATTGVRHSPPVTPVGEGVYSITTTGRESHLTYMLTIPAEMGAVQEEVGLADKGAFVLSVKNPEQKGPANTNLPEGAKFSKEIMEEFRGLRWMPCQPKHLDYVNAQVLLIGEAHGDLGNAVQPNAKDEKDDTTETPAEEMEKLEDEDEMRVDGLKGDDTVFVDLGISRKDYPGVATTW